MEREYRVNIQVLLKADDHEQAERRVRVLFDVNGVLVRNEDVILHAMTLPAKELTLG